MKSAYSTQHYKTEARALLEPLYELPPGGGKPPRQLAGHAHIAHFGSDLSQVAH